MKKTKMNDETVRYIIARLVDRADEAAQEYQMDKSNKFESGRALAYYEMLDILKTELDLNDQDLKDYGLDINLEARYLK